MMSDSPSTKHFLPGLGAAASLLTVQVYLQRLSTATPSLAVYLQLVAAYSIKVRRKQYSNSSSIAVHELALQ
jgi:hypothetical protein